MRSLKCLLIAISIGTTLVFTGCSDKTKAVSETGQSSVTSSTKDNNSSSNSSSNNNSSSSSSNSNNNSSTSANSTANSTKSSTASSSSTSSSSQTTAATTYKDGTYTGTARGYHPGLTVSVTVSGGKISNIEITSHNESRGYYEKPFQVVPQEIIAAQSTKVDAVSGATRSSNGIMNAVASALQSAK